MSPMTKCDEGHFYDKSQNSRCPFCGVGAVDLTRRYAPDAGDPPTRKYDDGDAEKTRMYSSTSKASGSGSGETRGRDDPDKTIAQWGDRKSGIDPVVGWLVCYDGVEKGRDYRIRSGFNSIGRDTSSQICIAGDASISRIDHAKIFYDSKKGDFHMVQGDGRSGAYVDGDVVLRSTPLKPYSKVEIGASKLMFVPFCGPHFMWDVKAARQEEDPGRNWGADLDSDPDITASAKRSSAQPPDDDEWTVK